MGNAENKNKNENKVFSNVTKRQFESKDKVSNMWRNVVGEMFLKSYAS